MVRTAIKILKIKTMDEVPAEFFTAFRSLIYENYLFNNGAAESSFDGPFLLERLGFASCDSVVLYDAGRAKMIACVSGNDFDSDVFGKKCARVDILGRTPEMSYAEAASYINSLVSFAKDGGYEFISARIDGGDFVISDAFVKSGFHSVDELDVFWMRAKDHKARSSEFTASDNGLKINTSVGFAGRSPDMLAKIKRLAGESFLKSRFYNDPFVKKTDADRFYDRLAGAFLEKGDSVNITAEKDGELAGFVIGVPNGLISGHCKADFIYLYLIAVSSSFQGMGAGGLLTESFADECFRRGYKIIEVGTQSYNFRAASLYERRGFRKCAYLRTLHFHAG